MWLKTHTFGLIIGIQKLTWLIFLACSDSGSGLKSKKKKKIRLGFRLKYEKIRGSGLGSDSNKKWFRVRVQMH